MKRRSHCTLICLKLRQKFVKYDMRRVVWGGEDPQGPVKSSCVAPDRKGTYRIGDFP